MMSLMKRSSHDIAVALFSPLLVVNHQNILMSSVSVLSSQLLRNPSSSARLYMPPPNLFLKRTKQDALLSPIEFEISVYTSEFGFAMHLSGDSRKQWSITTTMLLDFD
jgi:hypothetical protein